jgi:hypothetical protein
MFCAQFPELRTGLATFRAPISKVFVTDHATAEYHPFCGCRRHASICQFGQQLDSLALCQACVPPNLGCRHRLQVYGQVTIRLALMSNAQHVHPKAARCDAARLQGHVLSPVGWVELKRRALHRVAIHSSTNFAQCSSIVICQACRA